MIDLTAGLPAISGDRVHLQQVALNLIHNAAEAMASAETTERTITVKTGRQDAEHLIIEVRDTGPGVDPDVLNRMFDPFFTTKSEGLGMGLTICSSIIEAHDGRLWVTPNPDRGLIVHFTVPLSSSRGSPA